MEDVAKEITRERTPGLPWRILVVVFSISGLFIAVNYIFRLRLLGRLEFEASYLFTLFACFLSLVFIFLPATKGASRRSVPWYDILLFGLTLAVSIYLASVAFEAGQRAWDVVAPLYIVVVSGIFCLIALEALRRAGGMPVFVIALLFAVYPMIADYMPGLLQGVQFPPAETLMFHVLSSESLIGVISGVFGNILVGFMFFGVVLLSSGAAKAFMNFALALLGSQKGGPAKVSILASAMFGTMTGSIVSNIVTTGSFTIPTMKRTGYSPHFASAVEAVASTGGNIMPPVMGATAFIMAALLAIPYFSVVIAAAIPAILYYLALYMQVHAYAQTHNLQGIPRSELPSLKQALIEVWPYLFAIVALVYFLYMGLEGRAPFAASAILIILSILKKETRSNLKDYFFGIFTEAAKQLATIVGIIVGIGFIIGSFAVTGIGSSFAHEISVLAGNNLALLIVFSALGSLVLGTGMPVVACYIFLAAIIGPALVAAGIIPIAAHLFLFYWGLASNFTPPVAVGAYVAAALGKADFLKTAWRSMRLGILIYILPFAFVIAPALLLQTPPVELILPLTTIILGTVLLAAGLEGWLLKYGKLTRYSRLFIGISGALLVFPNWQSDIAGMGLFVLTIVVDLLGKKAVRPTLDSNNK